MSYGSYNNLNDYRSLPPILRLLDEFDQYSRSTDRASQRSTNGSDNYSRNHSRQNSFVPKFDIREDSEAFDLFGEFPGIDQKEIDIEFTDASTLTIKGHVQRSCKSTDNASSSSTTTTKAIPHHGVTIEDAIDEEDAKYGSQQQLQQKNTTQVKKSDKSEGSLAAGEKYWVTERNIGDFSRTFAFPVGIDQSRVKASMKNGILNIWIPKAKTNSSRKITISSS